MSNYLIPEAVLPGFKVIAGLSEDKVIDLAKLLDKFPLGGGGELFYRHIFDSNIVHSSDAIILAKTIFSFGSLLFINEKSIDDLAIEMTTAYIENTKENDIGIQLQNNLKVIFNHSDNLKETFKAFDLLSENLNLFRRGKILTDIRPIFNDKGDDNLQNAVILHNFKIEYLENGEDKVIYLGLDSQDIIALEKILNRAKKKESELKKKINNFQFINLKE